MYQLVKCDTDIFWLTEFLGSLDLSKRWDVEITEHKPNRTRLQNSLLWHWYGEIADQTGYHKDEVHALLAREFLKSETKRIMGKDVTIAQSTKDLTVKEFTEYLERICTWAAEYGFYLSKLEDFNQLRKAK